MLLGLLRTIFVLLLAAGGSVAEWIAIAGFMTHVTCRLTAKNLDQLRNPTLGNRVWATFTFTFYWPRKRLLYEFRVHV